MFLVYYKLCDIKHETDANDGAANESCYMNHE